MFDKKWIYKNDKKYVVYTLIDMSILTVNYENLTQSQVLSQILNDILLFVYTWWQLERNDYAKIGINLLVLNFVLSKWKHVDM